MFAAGCVRGLGPGDAVAPPALPRSTRAAAPARYTESLSWPTTEARRRALGLPSPAVQAAWLDLFEHRTAQALGA